mmetsp:Transcript_125/g.314  ORF Transcript_125/g.314 Transcript_125/m.314 type:complete len:202 (+) Transcript_125:1169-1774(+)
MGHRPLQRRVGLQHLVPRVPPRLGHGLLLQGVAEDKALAQQPLGDLLGLLLLVLGVQYGVQYLAHAPELPHVLKERLEIIPHTRMPRKIRQARRRLRKIAHHLDLLRHGRNSLINRILHPGAEILHVIRAHDLHALRHPGVVGAGGLLPVDEVPCDNQGGEDGGELEADPADVAKAAGDAELAPVTQGEPGADDGKGLEDG